MALIGTLTSGVSALKSFTKDLEVIGNNIANVNTTAFKSSTTAFTDDFSNTLRASQPSGAQAMQVGTGVKLSSITTRFTQGALSSTGQATDLGISGNGYFRVVNTADNTEYATRNGNFHWDDNGYLVNDKGMRVQGLTGSYTSGMTTTVGDVRQAQDVPNTLSVQSVSISRNGEVIETYSDGSKAVVSQILMQDYGQPSALMSMGDGLYGSLELAAPVGGITMTATGNIPGSTGLGTIESGTLELSNVDLTEEFSNMITAQRSFQASSRLVTVADNVLEEIVNLKR